MCFTQFDMPHNLESLHLTARIANRGFAAWLMGIRDPNKYIFEQLIYLNEFIYYLR